MAKRTKIGIIFRNYPHWTGGVNYIINLIASLNTLPDLRKPVLVIYTSSKDDFALVMGTRYPYLLYKNLNGYASNKYIHFFNRITTKINGRRWIVKYFSPGNISFIFPQPTAEIFRNFKNVVGWIPDFQEYYYPQFFSAEEIKMRSDEHSRVARDSKVIIFSSKDVLNDFNKFYPDAIVKKRILNFAVSNSGIEIFNKTHLELKYHFTGNYFISPNQFWVHKNHKVVIEAVELLKKNGVNVQVIFTGKEEDYRYPNYILELKKYVTENGLSDNIRFLGFVDKGDLLNLIAHSIAVIQPSLFEGWSTVIEDAKALGKFIIASSIEVHKEQLERNADFFNPKDANRLSEYLEKYFNAPPVTELIDYNQNIKKFGESFVDIANEFVA